MKTEGYGTSGPHPFRAGRGERAAEGQEEGRATMNYIGPSEPTWTVRVQTATEQAALDIARTILEQHSELEVQIERGELYRAVRNG